MYMSYVMYIFTLYITHTHTHTHIFSTKLGMTVSGLVKDDSKSNPQTQNTVLVILVSLHMVNMKE